MAPLSGAQFNGDELLGNNHENPDAVRPIPIYKKGTPEREAAVEHMASNIKTTYAHATDASQFAGETFYSHDAHGAAHAIAAGHNPDKGFGQMLRRTGGKTQETWGHEDIHELYGNRPEYAKSAHAAQDFLDKNRAKMRPHAHQETARKFEETKATPQHAERVERAAGVLARLSPQTPWHDNVSQAWEITQHPRDLGHELNTSTSSKRTEAETKIIGTEGKLHYNTNANIAHAARIWSGEETSDQNIATPEGNERGRVKIGSFYHNILHPRTSNIATVDFRASDVARGQTLNTQGPKYDENGPRKSAVDQRGMSSKGRYDMMDEAHQRAAEHINADPETDKQRIGGNPIRPHQTQAVTWFVESNRTGDYLESSASHRGSDITKGQGVRKQGRTRADLKYPAGQGPSVPEGHEHAKWRDTGRRW